MRVGLWQREVSARRNAQIKRKKRKYWHKSRHLVTENRHFVHICVILARKTGWHALCITDSVADARAKADKNEK